MDDTIGGNGKSLRSFLVGNSSLHFPPLVEGVAVGGLLWW
jgi:hypothetical protein